MEQSSELRLPGERVAHLSEAQPGEATYVYGGFIYASICGQEVRGPDGVVSIQKTNARAGQVLSPSDEVLVRVLRISQRNTFVEILCRGKVALEQGFSGVIRSLDVRSVDIDRVVMHESFRPGDIVRAEVLALGDTRSYTLTTAKPHLGVVHATGTVGVPMKAISLTEMECPKTGEKMKRKVAKLN